MFSNRTSWDLHPNRLTQALERLRRGGVPILDLTESNPTRCRFQYPPGLLEELSHPRGLLYDPDPLGLACAREAVASRYAKKGIPARADSVLLAASTSEAYGLLFRLLCGSGDQVLVPRPSYPLFDYLAGLADVESVSYPLRLGERWTIDFASLEQAVTLRSRAVVAVHPNNPTGSCLTRQERDALVEFCRARNLALIADEVFAEYRFEPASRLEEDRSIPPTLAGSSEALTFSLGGLSKFLGLPQMKLGWIVATGPAEQVHRAMERLELIADTTLSVNTAVQQALPEWLKHTSEMQGQIRRRIQANRRFLIDRLSAHPSVELLPADGGWSGVLRAPSISEEEDWALHCLEEAHVRIYPGYFFDFEERGIGVVSLLPLPETFQEGIDRLLRHL